MGWREKNRPPDLPSRWSWHGRSGSLGWLRYPRTMPEQRAWDEQYGRGGRSPRHLPTSWDDLPRFPERTWKRHRRHQYRPLE